MATSTDADSDNSSTADQIDVTFTGSNEIKEVACEGGLSPAEVKTLAEMIEEDPLWLQSPADGATDLPTSHRISRDALADNVDSGTTDDDSSAESPDDSASREQ
jgi:hypothetical protein